MHAKQFPTQHPSVKRLSNANARRAMDVALIMPALFLHVQRRCGVVGEGGEMRVGGRGGRGGEEKQTSKME